MHVCTVKSPLYSNFALPWRCDILDIRLFIRSRMDVVQSLQYGLTRWFRVSGIPQTMPVLLIGSFEYVKRFRNLKFTVKGTTDIQNSVLSSSDDTASSYHALIQRLINSQLTYYHWNGPEKFNTDKDCNWSIGTLGDSQNHLVVTRYDLSYYQIFCVWIILF